MGKREELEMKTTTDSIKWHMMNVKYIAGHQWTENAPWLERLGKASWRR